MATTGRPTRITLRHREILAAANLGYVTQSVTPRAGRRGMTNVVTARLETPAGGPVNITGFVATLIVNGYAQRTQERVAGNNGSMYGTWRVRPTDAGLKLLPKEVQR